MHERESRPKSLPMLHVGSDSLIDVEAGIRFLCTRLVRDKIALCVALARIKHHELYKQAGIASFKEYIESRRINIHYHTAHEYSRIGEMFQKYHRKLAQIKFGNEDGLKKLLLLEDALDRHNGREEFVFDELKRDTFRQFKKLTETSTNSEVEAHSEAQGPGTKDLSILEEEECLVLMPGRKEIIWFDPEIDSILGSKQSVRNFKRCIRAAACRYLSAPQNRSV